MTTLTLTDYELGELRGILVKRYSEQTDRGEDTDVVVALLARIDDSLDPRRGDVLRRAVARWWRDVHA